MKTLNVSKTMKLPLEVVTTATVVFGIRGSGKTNTGVVIVEELLDARQQVIIVDPLDVWWGLKGTAGDRTSGYEITVLGGQHGDVPLAEGDGKILADFLVDNTVPAILSLRHLTKSASRRFMTDFAEHFYHRKGERGKNTPVLLVVDEASLFVPQHVVGDIARLVGAIQNWVRQGRVAGIGCMLIDQRPATVNKDVTSQIELLVCHRLISSHDRKALKDWIEAHSTEEQQKQFAATVATLAKGEAWFWSPEWLNLFERVQVRARSTFDSSATPKAGQSIKPPNKLAPVELDRLKEKLAATIEKARADDPKELKKTIAELQKQIKSGANTKVETKVERVEVPLLTDKQLSKLDKIVQQITDEFSKIKATADKFKVPASKISPVVSQSRTIVSQNAPIVSRDKMTGGHKIVPAGGDGSLTATQQRILDTIAMLNSRGISVNRECVARWQKIHPNGGRYGTDLAALRSGGFLDGFQLTQLGLHAATDNAFSHGTDAVMEALPDATKVKLFHTVLTGGTFSRETLAEALGIHPNGGRYGTDLAWLRVMQVITDRGPIAVTDGARR